MALETSCLTDGCVYHTYVGARYETDELLQWDMDAVRSTHSSHVEVVVDIPTTLVLTEEQAEEIEKLLHNQVELVIAFALQRSRENKRKEMWKECPHCLWMSTEVHECPKCGTARDYKENDDGC